ncbi:MAG: hypothetical protein KatS3mg118_1252 [Paracoccaceae bacterium]|nr:MAG: hypothetical protein KatS3mg118_1252 [Paracoccaceae bacterium]
MASVLRAVSCRTRSVSRRLASAASVAAAAPTAELSTRLVTPITNSPVMKKKMAKGAMPARRSFSFSPSGMRSSSSDTVGASAGLTRQRTQT